VVHKSATPLALLPLSFPPGRTFVTRTRWINDRPYREGVKKLARRSSRSGMKRRAVRQGVTTTIRLRSIRCARFARGISARDSAYSSGRYDARARVIWELRVSSAGNCNSKIALLRKLVEPHEMVNAQQKQELACCLLSRPQEI